MNTPDHYKPNNVLKEEPIEIAYRSMSYECFKAICLFNVMKYTARFEEKGGEEDLTKAEDYIEYLRCAYRGESPLMAHKRGKP